MNKKISFEAVIWKTGNSYVLTVPNEWIKTGIIHPEIDSLIVSIEKKHKEVI